jgi:hypothetical protein
MISSLLSSSHLWAFSTADDGPESTIADGDGVPPNDMMFE